MTADTEPPETLATGWLWKRGSGRSIFGIKNWKRRFFALVPHASGGGGVLHYYDTRDSWLYGHAALGKYSVAKGARLEVVDWKREAGNVYVTDAADPQHARGTCDFATEGEGEFCELVDPTGVSPSQP